MRRDIFQAIADPTRRGILALIALQAMTPSAIADHLQMSRQAISKHMRILTECAVVSLRQEGREVYYQLEIDKMKEVDRWLEQYRRIWEGQFQELDQILKNMQKPSI
jgi:DNA-binding transcriptional ArsR family regulator